MTKSYANRFHGGFSIVELMVVIVVIGLLAAALLVTLSPVRAKTRDNKRKADIEAVNNAIQGYWAKHKQYPQTNSTGETFWLGSCTGNPTILYTDGNVYCKNLEWVKNTPDTNKKIVPDFISVLPKDPLSKDGFVSADSYAYLYRSTGKDYKLMVWKWETAIGEKWGAEDNGIRNAYELFSPGAQDW